MASGARSPVGRTSRISSGASTARLSSSRRVTGTEPTPAPSPPRGVTAAAPVTSRRRSALGQAPLSRPRCCHSSWISVPSSGRISLAEALLQLVGDLAHALLGHAEALRPARPAAPGPRAPARCSCQMARSRSSVSSAANLLIRSATAPDSSLRAAWVSGEAPPPGSRSSSAQALVVGARIQRDLARGEVGRHLLDVLHVDVQLGRQQLGRRVEAGGQQLLALALQAEEQLAPGPGVADVDQPGVGHQERRM